MTPVQRDKDSKESVLFRQKEGRQEHWEIFLNGEKWREVHRTIFGRAPKFPPVSADDSIQSVFDRMEYARVKKYVLWRLSAHAYHSEQLKRSLRERLVQEHTIAKVLKEFQNLSLLDDEAWLQSFIRVHQKRYSHRFISSKLYAKGIPKETIQRLEEEWRNPEEELAR